MTLIIISGMILFILLVLPMIISLSLRLWAFTIESVIGSIERLKYIKINK